MLELELYKNKNTTNSDVLTLNKTNIVVGFFVGDAEGVAIGHSIPLNSSHTNSTITITRNT